MPNHNGTSISIPAAVLLGVAVTAATTLAVIAATRPVVPEGTTALLASLTALGGTGVIICSIADRLMHRLDQLESKLDGRGLAYGPETRAAGQTYVSRSASMDRTGGQRPVDADTQDVPGRVQAGTMTEGHLDSPDAARTQGYAEGYVDGLARRRGDGPSQN